MTWYHKTAYFSKTVSPNRMWLAIFNFEALLRSNLFLFKRDAIFAVGPSTKVSFATNLVHWQYQKRKTTFSYFRTEPIFWKTFPLRIERQVIRLRSLLSTVNGYVNFLPSRRIIRDHLLSLRRRAISGRKTQLRPRRRAMPRVSDDLSRATLRGTNRTAFINGGSFIISYFLDKLSRKSVYGTLLVL